MQVFGELRVVALCGAMTTLAWGAPVAYVSLSSAPSLGAPLTMKAAVKYALESSPQFDTARKTQASNELKYNNAIAKLLPSLDFSTTDGLQNNIAISSDTGGASLLTPNPTSPWYSSLSLGLTETLYDNGVMLNQMDVASLGRELAAVSLLKSRDSLALDVATEFYRYSLATVLLEVRKQQQTILDKQFRALTSQFQQGFKPKSDYLRIKTQVQRAEIDRVSAENDITQSVVNLRKSLGVGVRSVEPLVFVALSVPRVQQAQLVFPEQAPALDQQYDFRLARIQDEINDRSVSLVRRDYWPRVSFASSLTYYNQSYLNASTSFAAGHQLSWTALLTLQYNVWDWGTRRRNIAISEYARDIQHNSIEQGLLDVNAKVTGLMSNIARVSRGFKLSAELLALEEESNRNMEAQYREGKVTYLDFITSVNGLLDAKIQYYTSYFEALTSTAQYRFYEGKIYETLVEN